MKNVIIIYLMFFCFQVQAQLKYLEVSDHDRYYDNEEGITKYPNLKLKKDKYSNLYLNDSLIFNETLIPIGYSKKLYEIYNDKYLIVTFCDSFTNGISEPFYIDRKDVFIIRLNSPHLIYKAKFDNIRILGKVEYLEKFKNLSEEKIYAISDIGENEIILQRVDGEKFKIRLNIERNPIIN